MSDEEFWRKFYQLAKIERESKEIGLRMMMLKREKLLKINK